MSDSTVDEYLHAWDPAAYLRQYYSGRVTRDDAANTSFAARSLRRSKRRFRRALEFGCGPTIHHLSPLVPFVDQVTLADCNADNLDAIRLWLGRSEDAFDWDAWLASMLEIELCCSVPNAVHHLPARKQAIRRMVRELKQADILRARPLGHALPFDLVTSYYCIEAVGTERAQWADCLGTLCSLVAPGGALLLSALRLARHYSVAGRTFRVMSVDAEDFETELPRHGFASESLSVEIAQVPEFAAHGFDSVLCVFAVKSA